MTDQEKAKIDLRRIRLEELKEDWPKDDSGKLASRLLRRYILNQLITTAISNTGSPISAGIEAGMDKALAILLLEFEDLGTGATDKPKAYVPMTATLNRNLSEEERIQREQQTREK